MSIYKYSSINKKDYLFVYKDIKKNTKIIIFG